MPDRVRHDTRMRRGHDRPPIEMAGFTPAISIWLGALEKRAAFFE
jgi:hypothetical protein